MEEIKIRAWDEFNAEMLYSENYKCLSEFFKSCEIRIEGENKITYMWWTGLKDKNGKDIYADDFCKSPVFSGAVRIEYQVSSGFFGNFPEITDLRDLEVFANVWENPEFLKG